MPSEDFFGSNLTQAISNNQVPLARLDDMVTRILTALYAVGAMDYNNTGILLLPSSSFLPPVLPFLLLIQKYRKLKRQCYF